MAPVLVSCVRVLNILGFDFHLDYHDVPPYHNAAPCHYAFASYVCTIGSPSTSNTFTPRYPEKDDRDFIQTRSRLPGNPKAGMAEDKRETDGRG